MSLIKILKKQGMQNKDLTVSYLYRNNRRLLAPE